MSANMYRMRKGEVHVGKTSVIEDRGSLRSAPSGSNGDYIFSEVGAGIYPMVLIGLPEELLTWLDQKQNRGIVNHINDLPEIYVGMEEYHPGSRYKGLFPLHMATASIIGSASAMSLPTGVAGTIIGNAGDAIGGYKSAKSKVGYWQKFKAPKYNGELYLSFSYLQGKKMEQIGSGRVDFGTVFQLVRSLF